MVLISRDTSKVELMPVIQKVDGEEQRIRWRAVCLVPDGVEVPGNVKVNRHKRFLATLENDPETALSKLWEALGGYAVLENDIQNGKAQLTLKDLMHGDRFKFAPNASIERMFTGLHMKCVVSALHCWGRVQVEQGWACIDGYENAVYRFPLDTPVVLFDR